VLRKIQPHDWERLEKVMIMWLHIFSRTTNTTFDYFFGAGRGLIFILIRHLPIFLDGEFAQLPGRSRLGSEQSSKYALWKKAR
jgi:hypothetical protein